jgi:hypothetical protein
MPQPRQLQQYQRLNAFGEPFRGSKIGGVKARRYMGGPSQGPLSERRYNMREEAEKEAIRQDRAEQESAAARGMAAAGGGASQSQPSAPKRQGQLVPTAGGGSKWASGAELDAMDRAKAQARRQARRTMDMSAKNAASVAAFGTGKPPAPMSAAEAAAADRAKARARYEAEKSGNAPAMPEKKPEMRKEDAMPAATHSSPVRTPTPKPKPASKPEPKLVAPHLLFTDRAKPEPTPAPKTRAIDSYVSNPANRSVMTGKSRAQELAEEAADKRKKDREMMFRPKYMPNKSRGF